MLVLEISQTRIEESRWRTKASRDSNLEMESLVARTLATIAATQEILIRTDVLIHFLREACIGAVGS